MYNQKIRKYSIYIILLLTFLFSCIAMINIVKASADESFSQSDLQYDFTTYVEGENVSSTVVGLSTNDDKDKSSTYKNLGSYRLLEGDQGLTQIHYIENANYFLANPLHHENDTDDNSEGTCTTVALQMLVGYHNYYSDRRLLPEFNANGERLLEENYGDLNEHPIISYRPASGLGRDSIGTSDNVYERIFKETFWGSFPGLGQAIGSVTSATRKFLDKDSDLKNWTLNDNTYNKQSVKAELDAGRPVIIGFNYFEGHSAHVVVAYGYANYDGNFCYITHYGWDNYYVQMLVPENWLGYQVTMTVDHAHTYELVLEETYTSGGTVYNVMECEVCGSTTLVDMATLFAGGTGAVTDPYLISNAEQFDNIRYAFRPVYVPRQGEENRITYAFKLTNSITIPGDWIPFTYKFAGKFDGNGYYISYNMNLSQADLNASLYQGLFGFVVDLGTIYDLELMNCKILSDTGTTLTTSSGAKIGILAGAISGAGEISNITITNPEITCKISGAFIGALAGSCFSTDVTNCVVQELNGTASITNNTNGYLGGMAGVGDVNWFSGGEITITLTNTSFNADKDLMGKIVGNAGDTVPSSIEANVTIDTGGCVAAGTLITLADGTQKAVEELTGNEMLLVWNLETGTFDVAPILFIDSDPARMYRVINLTFSDGTTVKTICEHGFWDYTLNQYVYLDKDAAQYIGHWFNKVSTDENGNRISVDVQLVSVVIRNEYTTAWSPVTYGYYCYYVNGMLSMPGGLSGMFNIFEVDAETMKYDEEQKLADIEEYGLFNYEEFAEIFPISEEVFEAFNGQYLKVAMGKGLIGADELQSLIERYSEFLSAI